jgi:hypothetical protein
MAKKKKELVTITSSESSTSLTQRVEALHPIGFYSPVNMRRVFRDVHTPEDALACATDSIGTLCRVNGAEVMEANISIQLVELQASLGVKNKLDEARCDEIAAEIVATYKQLSMADLHVILRRARTGEYGEFYERISMPKVLTWFREYFNERIKVALERNERETERRKNSYIGSDDRPGKPLRVAKLLKSIRLGKI